MFDSPERKERLSKMNNDFLQKLTELESEFIQEEKGNYSLSPRAVPDSANFSSDILGDEEVGIDFDIQLENIEALYYEGLKVPRWENIKADNATEKKALYEESFQKCTADYPLISRVSDTDRKVTYTPEEVLQLRQECERVLNNTNDPKAVKALHKFLIICNKVAGRRMGLLLLPS